MSGIEETERQLSERGLKERGGGVLEKLLRGTHCSQWRMATQAEWPPTKKLILSFKFALDFFAFFGGGSIHVLSFSPEALAPSKKFGE